MRESRTPSGPERGHSCPQQLPSRPRALKPRSFFLHSALLRTGMSTLQICALLASVVCAHLMAAPGEGMLPLGKEGQPLNLDFETGTLKDWVAVGPAFEKQPVRGDTVV